MEQELEEASRQLRFPKYYAVASSLAIVLILFSAFRQHAQTKTSFQHEEQETHPGGEKHAEELHTYTWGYR